MMDDYARLAAMEVAETPAQRAAWMLRQPRFFFCRHFAEVGQSLRLINNGDLMEALQAEIAAGEAEHMPSGDMANTVMLRLHFNRSKLREMVRLGGRV
ncbi:hypothetical protein ACQ3G6_17480 [Allorhizobium undicola]|uniref:hypothetical protein n=1 Tax=Allorhizobium undicola TaxID=78527 RepID=UPI003D34A37A